MNREDMLLNQAVQALRADEPASTDLAAASNRVAARLGLDAAQTAALEAIDAIESCRDVQQLLPAYRAASLSPSRSLLIEAHLHDCAACRRLNTGTARVLDWSAPRPARAFVWHPRAYGLGLAAALLLVSSGFFVYKAWWQVPPGVRAEVQSIDGAAYRISSAGDQPLLPGDRLGDGDRIRTAGGAHAVLRLADGSTVEINERSVLGVASRGRNTTVSLDDGDVIVQAARRTSGHLYVKTPDCRVAVTGTVFSVDSGLKGSRVAVLEGTVDVDHGGADTLVHAGDQLATSDKLTPAPVADQIAWSHDRDRYLPLLAQFAALEHQIGQIPFPRPLYASDLLARVPADTLVYVTVPNLGEFLNQANQIFHEQLRQSPVLREWWNQGGGKNSADVDMLVDKAHQMSQYLGDEIVIVGLRQPGTPAIAVLADIRRPGFEDFLRSEVPFTSTRDGISIFNEASLHAVRASQKQTGAFALVRDKEVVFSTNIATLRLIDSQLNAGPSGFATSDFGKQIGSAYSRGAGIVLAADLHQMVASKLTITKSDSQGSDDLATTTGIADARYLIAEHREIDGHPENEVALQFSSTRKGIASWLAAPASIGSLAFVTPGASIAVAALSKDAKAIADDILSMASSGKPGNDRDFQQAEDAMHVNFRDDIAASLGGDFALSLDGPVLPTPSWKAIIEVHDARRLEQAMERVTDFVRSQSKGQQSRSIEIQSSDANGQRFYAIHDKVSGTTYAQYTFAEGYMIVAPTRALVMEALSTYASGDSLAHSAAFRALLPKDASDNYSAVAYQNLTPVLSPLLGQMSGPTADTLRQLAADARPTAICARGEDNRIEASSDSRLLQLDFLTLQTLMNLGNNHAIPNVKE